MNRMEQTLSTKTHPCRCCGEDKPLDSFVRIMRKGFNRDKVYHCIDCKVNDLYGRYVKDTANIPMRDHVSEKGLKSAFRWLLRKV